MKVEQREIWLRTNRRALGVAFCLALLVGAAGGSLVALASSLPLPGVLRGVGWLTIAASAYFALSLLYQMTLPRLAYRNGELLVYMTTSQPIAVPIEIVELFFAGQGGSTLPSAADVPSKSRTAVVRLAEAATEWHARDVRPAWGEWREAYIIIRGTWCEPLTPEVFQRLNRRLREVKRGET